MVSRFLILDSLKSIIKNALRIGEEKCCPSANTRSWDSKIMRFTSVKASALGKFQVVEKIIKLEFSPFLLPFMFHDFLPKVVTRKKNFFFAWK